MIVQHLKTSFSYIRRSPFQALAAISILSLTFFVSTLIAILVYASNQLLVEFERRPQIIAFLKKDASMERMQTLSERLKEDSRIKDVKLVSKEEAVEIYKSITSDNPLLGELVSPTIFPASLEFSTKDLQFAGELIDEMKREDIVESVGFTASVGGEQSMQEVLSRLRSITYYVRVGGIGAVGVLAVTSLLVLMVVIGMRITTRKGEVETLSLIGATKGFIRLPIVFEALNYSLLGAFLGWTFGLITILYATPTLLSYFQEIAILPKDSFTFFALFGIILGIELLASLFIGLIGSLVAVSRAFK